MRKALLPFLILISLVLSCSSSKPPDDLFHDNIKKMVLLDRAMGFKEEITKVSIVSTTVYENQVEVEVRVEGYATHSDIAIGATLPASKVKSQSWATWKFFTVKMGENWTIKEKYKVAEGFEEQEPESRSQEIDPGPRPQTSNLKPQTDFIELSLTSETLPSLSPPTE